VLLGCPPPKSPINPRRRKNAGPRRVVCGMARPWLPPPPVEIPGQP
jgi:hypothetical protein